MPGAGCWLCRGGDRVAVHVVETGCRALVLGAEYIGAVRGELSVLVPASDSEVMITTAASDSEG